MEKMTRNVLILGGGYCGLAAAVELVRNGVPVTIVEKTGSLGGLSQTVTLGGVKFELGPHIYFDKDKEVKEYWREVTGGKFSQYLRDNRIFYSGKYIKSPLSVPDTFMKLGPFAVSSIMLSFLAAKFSKKPIRSAEDWVTSNFGHELFRRFFKVYNEKIWGIDSSEMTPNWAGQRIKSSLFTMIMKSVKRDHDFVIKTFDFPDGGSEVVCSSQEEILRKSGMATIRLNETVTSLENTNSTFHATFSSGDSAEFSHVIYSIHLSDLNIIIFFSGKNDSALSSHIESLLFRNLLVVNFVFKSRDVTSFKEHWIDIHDPRVKALRVTNFSNYDFGLSTEGKSAIGLEYNCFPDDDMWRKSDEEIKQLALQDLRTMKLIDAEPSDFSAIRIPKAYPIYFIDYEKQTNAIFAEFGKVGNLILAGRNAMYKWNNMHHSVKTGLLAARNVLGGHNDLFSVKGMVTIGKDSD